MSGNQQQGSVQTATDSMQRDAYLRTPTINRPMTPTTSTYAASCIASSWCVSVYCFMDWHTLQIAEFSLSRINAGISVLGIQATAWKKEKMKNGSKVTVAQRQNPSQYRFDSIDVPLVCTCDRTIRIPVECQCKILNIFIVYEVEVDSFWYLNSRLATLYFSSFTLFTHTPSDLQMTMPYDTRAPAYARLQNPGNEWSDRTDVK